MTRTRLAQSNLRPYFGAKVHREAVQIAAARRQLAQRERQSAAFGAYGQQAAGKRARRLDRMIHQADDLVDAGDPLGTVMLEARRETAQHERDPGELLAETVVQIAPDGLALPARHVENLLFETLALGNVGHADGQGRADAVVVHEHGATLKVLRLAGHFVRLEGVDRRLTGVQNMPELRDHDAPRSLRQDLGDLAPDDLIDAQIAVAAIDEAHLEIGVDEQQRVGGVR